jgi:hypothetical protein
MLLGWSQTELPKQASRRLIIGSEVLMARLAAAKNCWQNRRRELPALSSLEIRRPNTNSPGKSSREDGGKLSQGLPAFLWTPVEVRLTGTGRYFLPS